MIHPKMDIVAEMEITRTEKICICKVGFTIITIEDSKTEANAIKEMLQISDNMPVSQDIMSNTALLLGIISNFAMLSE